MGRLGLVLLVGGIALGVTAGLALGQEITAPPKAVTAPAAASVVTTPSSPTPPPTAPAAEPPLSATPPAASEVVATPKAAPPAPAEPPKPPPEPLKRPRFNAAVMQGVDKITAETLRFEVKVGAPVRYKGLIITAFACETTAADEAASDSIAHVAVQSQPEILAGKAAAPPRQVFKGWMFASSPTLHTFEHPIYDLWLIACKTAAPGA